MSARPTARGVGTATVAVAAGATGVAFHSHALLLLASAVLAVICSACAAAVVVARRPVEAFTWAAPALVAAGSPASVGVAATGSATVRIDRARGRWRNVAGATAEDTGTPPPGRLAPTPGALDTLSPSGGGGQRMSESVPTGARGILVLPGRRLWRHDPLGLVGAVVASVPAVTVVVHPAPVAVEAATTRTAAGAATTRPAVAPAGGGGGGELEGVRPYVAGDPLHLVHWPSLARPGPPLVKDFGSDGGVERRVLVDDRAGVHRRESFESILAAACGLVVTGWHAGTPVVLATWSGTVTAVGDTTDDLARAMVTLAAMSPRPDRGGGPPDGPVVTVTSQAGVAGLPASLVRTGSVVAVP